MPYINIEEKIIQEALDWLSTNQASNGSFPEVGKVSHQDMQGGAGKGLALTAYTLIAFLENQVCVVLYRQSCWMLGGNIIFCFNSFKLSII
jgi:CD109 antigen